MIFLQALADPFPDHVQSRLYLNRFGSSHEQVGSVISLRAGPNPTRLP